MKKDQPETLALDKPVQHEVATAQPFETPMSLIARMAADPSVDVSKLKELMQMRKEWEAEQAKKAFDKALADFQAECPVIQKAKPVVVSGRSVYAYAPLEYVVTIIKPLLQKHGLRFTFDTDVNSEPGWVIAHCDVKHSEGHKERSTAKFPLGTKTNLMSDTQQYSAALTFATRRVLSNAFGLVFAGEDLDGMVKTGAKLKVNTDLEAKLKHLWDLLKPVRGNAKPATWQIANEWMWSHDVLDAEAGEEAPNLTIEQLTEAINRAEILKEEGTLK